MNKRLEYYHVYKSLPWYHRADLFLFAVFLRARYQFARILPSDRRAGPQYHFINDRRKPRIENFAVFIFLQSVMGVTAMLSAFQQADPRLVSWMITSFIFSSAMFITYKTLFRAWRVLQRNAKTA